MWPLQFTKITEIPLGFFSIKIWGFMVAMGMLMGLLISIKTAVKKGISKEFMLDLFFWTIVSAMIGGRLFYVLQYLPEYFERPLDILKIWEGGLTFYGGVIGGLAAMLILLKKHNIRFWKMADILAPGVALGIGIGRLGCFLIGDHLGKKTDFLIASEYLGEMRHEPSFWLVVNGWVLFAVLMYFRKRFEKEGTLAMFTIVWYTIARFLIDFLRAEDLGQRLSDPRLWGLTYSQILSLIILGGTLGWAYKKGFFKFTKQ